MYLSDSILESVYGQAAGETVQEITTQELMAALSVYLVVAAVTTPIAVCILVWIMKNEGRQEAVRLLFRGRRERKTSQIQPGLHEDFDGTVQLNQTVQPNPEYLLSVPLILAIVLSLGFMSLEWFLL